MHMHIRHKKTQQFPATEGLNKDESNNQKFKYKLNFVDKIILFNFIGFLDL